MAFAALTGTAKAGVDFSLVWTGGGLTANWTNINNWLLFSDPYSSPWYNLRFASGSARLSNVVNQDVEVSSITFTDELGSASSYTINGPNRINMDGGVFNDMTSPQSVLAPIRWVGTDSSINNRRDGRVGGRITVGPQHVASDAVRVFASSNGVQFNGAVTGGPIVHHGPGPLILNAASSHNGGILVLNGAVEFGFGSALGAVSNFIAFEGASGNQPALRRTSSGATVLNMIVAGHGAWLPVASGLTHTITGRIRPTASATTTAGINKTEGGTLVLQGALSFRGTTAVRAGTLRAETNLPYTPVFVDAGATLELVGGVHTLPSFTNAGTISLLNNAEIATGAGVTVGGGREGGFDVASSGSITGSTGRLTKRGAETAFIRSANSYGGGTVIGSGMLVVKNVSGSATGTGPVTLINANSTLAGDGRINGPLTVSPGTIVLPGDPGGALRTGQVIFETNSTLNIRLSGTGVNQNGKLDVLGGATADIGRASLVLTRLNNYVPSLGTSHEIIQARNVLGIFTTVFGVVLPAVPDIRLAVTYLDGPDDFVRVVAARPGDANLDQTVGFADLLLLAQSYETPGIKTWARGDFDGDGIASFPDLLALAQFYTTPATLPGDWAHARALVPEPATAALLAASLLTLRRRR